MPEALPAYLKEADASTEFSPPEALLHFLGNVAFHEAIVATSLQCDVATGPLSYGQIHQTFEKFSGYTPWVPVIYAVKKYCEANLVNGWAALPVMATIPGREQAVHYMSNDLNRARRIEAYSKIIPWALAHPTVSTQDILGGYRQPGKAYPLTVRLPIWRALLEAQERDKELEYQDIYERITDHAITPKVVRWHVRRLIDRGLIARSGRQPSLKLSLAPMPGLYEALESFIDITDQIAQPHPINARKATANHRRAVVLAKSPQTMGALLHKASLFSKDIAEYTEKKEGSRKHILAVVEAHTGLDVAGIVRVLNQEGRTITEEQVHRRLEALWTKHKVRKKPDPDTGLERYYIF